MRRFAMGIAGASLAISVIALSAPAQAVVATDVVKCQKKIASETRTHYDAIFNAYKTCYEKALGGKDCDFAGLTKALTKARQTLMKNIRKTCVGDAVGDELLPTGSGVGLLDDLGFAPGSCRDIGETPGELSFRELTRCIVSQNLQGAQKSLTAAIGCTTSTFTFSGAGFSSSVIMAGLTTDQFVALSGQLDLCIASDVGPGKHAVVISSDTAFIDPVLLSPTVVCPRIIGGGGGQIDCTGSAGATTDKLPNFLTMQDHATTPANASNVWTDKTKVCNNSGTPYATRCTVASALADCGNAGACTLTPKYGKADDATCTKAALSSGSTACLEADCDGTAGSFSGGDGKEAGICTGCAAAAFASHGACNSPVDIVGSSKQCDSGPYWPCFQDSDCWASGGIAAKCKNLSARAAGEMVVTLNVSLDASLSAGPNSIYCDEDDTYIYRGAPTTAIFTTGTAQAGMADADALTTGKRLWDASTDCLGSPCFARRYGIPKTCSVGGGGEVTVNTIGLSLVSAAPLIDSIYKDVLVTQNFLGD